MAVIRSGFSDSLTNSRLAWLTGTAFPASPSNLYIALFSGLPLSDGSGGAEVVRVGPITYGAPQSIAGCPEGPSCRFVQPTAPVNFTPPGQASPGAHLSFEGSGIFGVAGGGVPLYIGNWAGSLLIGVPTSLPASTFQIFAEQAGQ
jgi:hypothetical protein